MVTHSIICYLNIFYDNIFYIIIKLLQLANKKLNLPSPRNKKLQPSLLANCPLWTPWDLATPDLVSKWTMTSTPSAYLPKTKVSVKLQLNLNPLIIHSGEITLYHLWWGWLHRGRLQPNNLCSERNLPLHCERNRIPRGMTTESPSRECGPTEGLSCKWSLETLTINYLVLLIILFLHIYK